MQTLTTIEIYRPDYVYSILYNRARSFNKKNDKAHLNRSNYRYREKIIGDTAHMPLYFYDIEVQPRLLTRLTEDKLFMHITLQTL